MRLFLIALSMLCSFFTTAQTWENVTSEHPISHQVSPPGEYGAGVSFYDVNRDGWDDITVCNNGSDIWLYLNIEGTFASPIYIVENEEEAKHVTWADYDNDGDPDLFLSSYNAPFKLFENDGNLSLTDISSEAGLPTTYDLTFGHCWGDYNRDGFIDLYVCNYNGALVTNFLFMNNGDGTFTDVTQELNVGDGSCHSFQPAFLDVNNDLWPDLFVINDRENCRNTLFINEEGNFNDVTEDAGLDDYIFAMNNTAADYDHDGDLDMYITNNPFGNRFKRNNGDGTFSEVASQLGLSLFDHSWSAQWVDIDNDTWEDLHVCVSPFWGQPGQNRFFLNNGNTFDDMTYAAGLINEENWSHSSATGDFNNDGFPDLFVVNDIPDWSQLFMSVPNENNYTKVLLTGTVSNRDGIGSWIDVFAGNTHQRKFTQCGEGYMSQNARSELFGLGQAEIIDSMIISWPSGIIDKWYNLGVNGLLELTEGSSDTAVIQYESLWICPGSDLLLTADTDPGDNVVWSNGQTDDSLFVNSPGAYWLELTDSFGLTYYSDTIQIESADSLFINLEPLPLNCAHIGAGSIDATFQGEAEVTEVYWNDQQSDSTYFESANIGWNHIEVISSQNCLFIDSVFMDVPDTLNFQFTIDQPECSPYGSVDFEVSGGAGGYVLNWGNLNPIEAVGGTYEVEISDMLGCTVDTILVINEGPSVLNGWVLNIVNAENGMNGSAELSIYGGTPPYSIIWLPIGIEDQLQVDGLGQGSYTVEITDANGCFDEAQFTIIDTYINELKNAGPTAYPNPFQDHLTFDQIPTSPFIIVFYNARGQEVLRKECISPSCQVGTTSLSRGIYAVSIENTKGMVFWTTLVSKE